LPYIFAGVAFASDVKVVFLEGREEGEELQKCVVEIFANIDLISRVAFVFISETKASAHGVININNVVVDIPRIFACFDLSRLCDFKWTIFSEKTKKRGRSGTT
jgi:phenolic acid decarboxylase